MGLRAVIMVALLAGGCSAASGHGDPDPGGRILGGVRPVLDVVPAGADVLSETRGREPQWDSCDGRAGTFGWDDVVVTATFRSSLRASDLVAAAARRLAATGWSAPVPLSSPLGTGARWTRTLPDGTVATASLLPGSFADGSAPYWTLVGSAPPHGRRASGC